MHGREARTQLRGAVARGDGRSIVALLREGTWPEHALQLIGDGLVGSTAVRIEGAEELAGECIDALRERDWAGDAELADRLRARLGIGPEPMLRPLPVDLEELADVLEGDPSQGGGRIDLHTGQVWPQAAIEYAEEMGGDDPDDADDADRWLWVECEGSHSGYRDMELFIDELEDRDKADRLSIAIEGRGAFRRFKDVLTRWPDLVDRWYAFSEDRRRGRARAWLAAAGYTTATPRREA
jgi:hypothetical protein